MLRFHPSSIGDLMSDAVSIDPALLTGELAVIARKTKKTDEEKVILLPLKQQTLSVGAKTALTTMAKEFIFGYRKVVDTKQMQKGLMLEAAAIRMLGALDFCRYEKNTERRTCDLLTGECDIYVPGVKTIDTKVPWDISTFPVTPEDAHDTGYEWQGRSYMRQWDVQRHDVEFLLLDTPDELIRWEQIELHRVSHIPLELRRTTVTYMRDAALEQKMITKLIIAQRYLENLVDRILETHGQPITRKKAMTDIAPEVPAALTAAAELAAAQAAPEGAELTPAAQELNEQQGTTRFAATHPTLATEATSPSLKLGEIGQRLGFTITADFLLTLGFSPAATEKNSKLFHESSFKDICSSIIYHVEKISGEF